MKFLTHLGLCFGFASNCNRERAQVVLRILMCVQVYHLPIHMPQLTVPDLMEKMAVDKKNKGGKKYITLLNSIGSCHMNKVCSNAHACPKPLGKKHFLVGECLLERAASAPWCPTHAAPACSPSLRVLTTTGQSRIVHVPHFFNGVCRYFS